MACEGRTPTNHRPGPGSSSPPASLSPEMPTALASTRTAAHEGP